MTHSFAVGGLYRNRSGDYEVIRLHEPLMDIRYADGREASINIACQTRIWENIQIDQQSGLKPLSAHPESKTGRSRGKKPDSFSERWGAQFNGLVDNDFQRGVTGTTWRRRTSLGSLLAQQLSDQVAYDFWPYTTYRRSQVFISIPYRHAPNEWFPAAKFEFRLDNKQALYGYYFEKSDGPMDSTWDWRQLIRALTSRPDFLETIENRLRQHNLYWGIIMSHQRNSSDDCTQYEAGPAAGLLRSDSSGQSE